MALTPPAGDGSLAPSAAFTLAWRSFHLPLRGPLCTARGVLAGKRGWLLRLETEAGALGWGEAAPLDGELAPLARALAALPEIQSRAELEARLPALPPTISFAIGAALAELAGLPRGRWRPTPAPALLLPPGEAALAGLVAAASERAPQVQGLQTQGLHTQWPHVKLHFKWKVAVAPEPLERRVLEELLRQLPPQARLRLDANGGWDRDTAARWAERLEGEPWLAWLEQPLAAEDHAGLEALAKRFPALPIALDESLGVQPELRRSWRGWQVRRPSQDGDPRPLLAALECHQPRWMLSTAFETGIGARWLHHLAAVQLEGPTPAPPGLAPGWQPGDSPLLSAEPQVVWEAAG